MLLCWFRLYQNVVVRRRFVLVVIRLNIIFAHGMIFKFVPHQDTAQIGMTIEDDPIEVKNLALLKFRTSPDWSKRREMNFIGSVFGSQPEYDWPLLFLHRIEVINRFKISGR